MIDSTRMRIAIPKMFHPEILRVAKARNQKEKRFGKGTYTADLDSLGIHIGGVATETGAGMYFGVDIDKKIFKDRGDSGVDLVLGPPFFNVQVKSTSHWAEPYLRAEVASDRPKINTYFAMYADSRVLRERRCPDAVWLIGWMPRLQVIKQPQVRYIRGGPLNYQAKEEELNDFDDYPPVPEAAKYVSRLVAPAPYLKTQEP